MAVIGIDGIELGLYTNPRLTTIDHPRVELGRQAVNRDIASTLCIAPSTAERHVANILSKTRSADPWPGGGLGVTSGLVIPSKTALPN